MAYLRLVEKSEKSGAQNATDMRGLLTSVCSGPGPLKLTRAPVTVQWFTGHVTLHGFSLCHHEHSYCRTEVRFYKGAVLNLTADICSRSYASYRL